MVNFDTIQIYLAFQSNDSNQVDYTKLLLPSNF